MMNNICIHILYSIFKDSIHSREAALQWVSWHVHASVCSCSRDPTRYSKAARAYPQRGLPYQVIIIGLCVW
jgi:hypothetical protein